MTESEIEHQVKRFREAISHDFEVQPAEKPIVAVKDKDSKGDEFHAVNLEELFCTCEDYKYNCGTDQHCKHLYRAVLEKMRMV